MNPRLKIELIKRSRKVGRLIKRHAPTMPTGKPVRMMNPG